MSTIRVGAWCVGIWMGCAAAASAAQQPAYPPARAIPGPALRVVREIAIQHNGRHKPFESFARETLQAITGSSRVGSQDPVATVLSIVIDSDEWQAVPLLAVPFRPLRERLGMEARASHVSYNDLVASRTLMRMLPAIVQKQERDEKFTMLEQETMDAFERFRALSDLLQQRLELVPPPAGQEGSWLPIMKPDGYSLERQKTLQDAWNHFLDAVRSGEPRASESAAQSLANVLRVANPDAYPAPWRLALEVRYHHAAPFHIARFLYVLAGIGLILALIGSPAASTRLGARIGLAALVCGFAVHLGGIAVRVVLGGRPPVSNFYETMLWLPFVAVALSLVFESIYRARYFAFAASILAVIMLTLADYVPLDSSISPVVAVLRSNLWLTVHVLTIVASYGALALATVLAHIYSVAYLRRVGRAALDSLDLLLYRVVQVGVILLAGGIMLGAVWANASWGRYWGWDPKETWALITLLWFLAALHGRFAGWLRGIGMALATIGGFFLLLMTYYGVSFYLVGLHSYAGGHAKPVPALLVGYLIGEAAFLLVVGQAALRRGRAEEERSA